jgi:hypothetical protein
VNELFSIYLILPAALSPGVHSASNRNEHQKQKIIMFLWSRVRPVLGLTASPPSVSRLSRHFTTLWAPRPVTSTVKMEAACSCLSTRLYGVTSHRTIVSKALHYQIADSTENTNARHSRWVPIDFLRSDA